MGRECLQPMDQPPIGIPDPEIPNATSHLSELDSAAATFQNSVVSKPHDALAKSRLSALLISLRVDIPLEPQPRFRAFFHRSNIIRGFHWEKEACGSRPPAPIGYRRDANKQFLDRKMGAGKWR
jgi:hypothetical protein